MPGQQESAQVVDGEIRLDAIGGELAATHDDASVMDEIVQRRPAGGDVVGQALQFAHVTEIGLHEIDVGVSRCPAQVLLRLRTFVSIPSHDDEMEAPLGQPKGDLLANPVRTASDESPAMKA